YYKMDNSGNNRYELLFMDDDGTAAVLPSKVPDAVAGKKKSDDRPARQNINKTEKENKSSVLNKNNAQSKVANGVQKATSKPIGSTAVKETRPRQITRNNHPTENSHSNGPDYNNELPRRQNRDRDIRGPPSRFRNNEKFGKREFDRQSGSDKTGVKPVDKREGGGAHNWGSAKQDIEDQKTGEPAPVTDKDDSGNEQVVGDQANIVEEDESKQMTLDEWKALKDQRAKPNYNLRKAGEGVDNAEWKKMIVLGKKKGVETEEEFEYDPSMYPQRVGRLQRIVDIQYNFNDGRKAGFRKGGPRGPPRGGPRPEGGPTNGF
ncbi:hypothetical protein KR093_001672, partial [Drosophila rubida]